MIHRRAFVLSLAALAGACSRGADLSRLIAGETGQVVSVRSGEVLTLSDGLEVRLAGLEAPNGGEPLADEARALLTSLAQGQDVSLHYGGLRRDRYERALAHVRTSSSRLWLQGAMLEAGLARVRTYSDNRALAAEMLEAEARARNAGLGLWALPAYAVLLPGECGSKSGFQIVEGRVSGVRSAGENTVLDLAGGARAQIPGFAIEGFAAAGRAPQTLSGQLVRVRGTLRSGTVRLDHPETLEILREA